MFIPFKNLPKMKKCNIFWVIFNLKNVFQLYSVEVSMKCEVDGAFLFDFRKKIIDEDFCTNLTKKVWNFIEKYTIDVYVLFLSINFDG